MVKKISTHKNFLEKLENFGITEGYFKKETIGNISKTCCNSALTEVIDFDKTKEKVSQEKSLQEPKSCDALKIFSDKNRVDFIEFKSFQKFIHYNKKQNFQKKLKEKIVEFDFASKINDSLFILQNLVNDSKFKATIQEKSFFNNTEKYYTILVDIDLQKNPVQDFAFTLAALSEISSSPEILVKRELENLTSNFKTSALHNLKKPILKSCSNIDEYYQNI